MPSFPFSFGPVSVAILLFQAGVLLAVAWPLGRLLGWRRWWSRPILVAMSWMACSAGGLVLFGAMGADVFIIPVGLAMSAVPAALLAVPLWWLGDWLVKKID